MNYSKRLNRLFIKLKQTINMKIQQHIDEVQAYFKAKILLGDFEVKNASIHSINIIIDKQYKFSFLIYSDNLVGQESLSGSFIQLNPTEKESNLMAGIFKKLYRQSYCKAEVIKREKELEALKKELDQANEQPFIPTKSDTYYLTAKDLEWLDKTDEAFETERDMRNETEN